MSKTQQLAGLETDQRLTPEAMGQLIVILKSAKEATRSLSSAIHELDAKERALAERITEIETFPPSKPEFIDYAKAGLAQQAADWKRDLADAFAVGFAGHQATPLDVVVSRDAAGVETIKTSQPRALNLLVGDPATPGATFQSNIAEHPVTGRLLAALLADLIEPRLEKILNEIDLPFPATPDIALADRAGQIQRLRHNLAEVRRQRASLEQEIEAITADKLKTMTPEPEGAKPQ